MTILERILGFVSIWLPLGVSTAMFEVLVIWLLLDARPNNIRSSIGAVYYLAYCMVFWPAYWFWLVVDVIKEYQTRKGKRQ